MTLDKIIKDIADRGLLLWF